MRQCSHRDHDCKTIVNLISLILQLIIIVVYTYNAWSCMIMTLAITLKRHIVVIIIHACDLTGFLYEGSWSPLVRILLPYLDASMMKDN